MSQRVDLSIGRERVLDFLKSYSVKVAIPGREFELASGGRSRFYIDAKKTVQHRAMHHPVAALLLDKLEGFHGVDGVAGVVLGGCHLASIVAAYAAVRDQLLYNVVYVRKTAKDHGTRVTVEAPWTSRMGERVVLFEDVLSTGTNAAAASRALQEAGYDVLGTIALFDRRPASERTAVVWGMPLASVFVLEDLGLPGGVTDLIPGGSDGEG